MLLLCPDSTSAGRVYCACALLGTGFAVASAPGLARGQRAAAAAGFRRDLGSFSVIAGKLIYVEKLFSAHASLLV